MFLDINVKKITVDIFLYDIVQIEINLKCHFKILKATVLFETLGKSVQYNF